MPAVLLALQLFEAFGVLPAGVVTILPLIAVAGTEGELILQQLIVQLKKDPKNAAIINKVLHDAFQDASKVYPDNANA